MSQQSQSETENVSKAAVNFLAITDVMRIFSFINKSNELNVKNKNYYSGIIR
jgi:hypothetical protein